MHVRSTTGRFQGKFGEKGIKKGTGIAWKNFQGSIVYTDRQIAKSEDKESRPGNQHILGAVLQRCTSI